MGENVAVFQRSDANFQQRKLRMVRILTLLLKWVIFGTDFILEI